MANEKDEFTKDNCNKYWMKRGRNSGGGDAVFGLGFIGALVYFWMHANSFWTVVLGFLKAIVWPAFLVYHLLGFLHI